MYRCREDIEEISRLDEERLRLLVENREMKKKMERKKNKIQGLKKEVEQLTKALAHASPFIDLPIEDESSIPFDDIGERIIVRDGKQIKQVKHLREINDSGEEIGFLTEWELTKQELGELTKQELEEIEKEKRKIEEAEEAKQNLKEEVERLTKALAQAQYSQYEKEQQELRHAELQKFQLSPFIDLPKEDESSIPFDDIGERIIVRDGKQIKQVKHIRGVNSNGEEIGFLTEWELTKQELEEIEKEKRKIADAEEKKQFLEKQNRISEEEPSIPYNKNDERIITRDGKKFKQWFWVGSGSDIWYDEIEIVDE
jgi:hypothetical protein